MCVKCGYKNIDINTKKAQETAFKVQLAQALTVGVVGFMNCIFSAADPNFSSGVSTTYKKRTEEVEEKTEFNVVLKEVGGNKIAVIKAVRELTGLGLVEAKNLVEKLGTIKEAAPKDEAEKMVAKLKEAGATAAME